MNLSILNILDLQNEGNLKRLSTFIFLKSLYKNSCIFNYNIKSLSKKSGLSRHIIRNNVEFFMDSGWCKMHHKNLIFRKYNRDPLYDGEWIIRKRNEFIGKTIKDITTILLSKVLKQKNVNFNWIQERLLDLKKSKTSKFIAIKDYKRALKAENRYNIKGETGNFKMTEKSIGRLFNISRSSSGNLIRNMKLLKLVKVTHTPPKFIGYGTSKYFDSVKDIKPGLFMVTHNGRIYQGKCNEYAFF